MLAESKRLKVGFKKFIASVYPQSLISPVSLFPRVGNCLIDISNDVIYVLQADCDSN
jgi:hypothetical protein